MWNPDRAPKMGFEQLAKRFGVNKARRIFDAYREKLRLDNHRASQQEAAAAAARARRGPVVVRNDFDFAPAYHITPLTYKQLHRSTLGQRGCKGGEVFDDDEAMRDFLKRNPECAPSKIVTGDIRSGWTSALERAAIEGRMNRALEMAKVSLTLKAAAAQGQTAILT